MKKYWDNWGGIILILAAIFIFMAAGIPAIAQDKSQYSQEKYIVQVGWKIGKFDPDTAGIRKALDRAVIIKAANPGQFVTIDFEPGVYDLKNRGVKLHDSINIKAENCVFNCSDTTHGTFYDDSLKVTVSIKGFPEIKNAGGLYRRVMMKNAASVVNDFWWEYSGVLNSNDEYRTITPYGINTLGITGWDAYLYGLRSKDSIGSSTWNWFYVTPENTSIIQYQLEEGYSSATFNNNTSDPRIFLFLRDAATSVPLTLGSYLGNFTIKVIPK